MLNAVILQGVYKPTMSGLASTGMYFNDVVSTVPTVSTFLYNNILTNPIFYGILVVILILSLVTFSD